MSQTKKQTAKEIKRLYVTYQDRVIEDLNLTERQYPLAIDISDCLRSVNTEEEADFWVNILEYPTYENVKSEFVKEFNGTYTRNQICRG